MIVAVLDMDETLGVSVGDVFHVRPHVDFMVSMLRCMGADVILWSMGEDDYVQRVVNRFLPLISKYAYKIFARAEAKRARKLYGYAKAGNHIRELYEEDIYLLGVDDQADANMDSAYDVKIRVQPYKKPDPSDSMVWYACDTIVKSISATLPVRESG